MRAPGLKYVTHSDCVNCPYFIEPGHRNNLHLSSSPHLRSIIFKFIHPEISRYFHRMNHLTDRKLESEKEKFTCPPRSPVRGTNINRARLFACVNVYTRVCVCAHLGPFCEVMFTCLGEAGEAGSVRNRLGSMSPSARVTLCPVPFTLQSCHAFPSMPVARISRAVREPAPRGTLGRFSHPRGISRSPRD